MLDAPQGKKAAGSPGDGTILLARDRSGALCLHNHRLTGIAAALRGRPVAEAPGLVSRLWPVCGIAQGIACRRAIEAAMARPASAETEQARDRLVLAEAAVGALWRLSLDWPSLLGRPPDPSPLKAGRASLARLCAAYCPEGDAFADPSLANRAEAERAAAELAGHLEKLLGSPPQVASRLAGWARRISPAIAEMLDRAEALLPGTALWVDAPAPGVAEIASRLQADASFGRAPDLAGKPVDPGALPLLAAGPREACAALGPLAGRYLAMLSEMATLARALAAPAATGPARSGALADSIGAGAADTLRGALVHVVTVDGARIAEFRSVAPTEWLLHPQGALNRALAALPPQASEADLRLAIAAFDPCAPIQITAEGVPDA